MNNKNNDVRLPSKSDEDVFLARHLQNADFNTGFYQFPAIKNCNILKPKDTVLWSKRHLCNDKTSTALVFYEYDGKFDGKDGIYNILKYGTDDEIEVLVNELKRYAFVVCPDYSVYGNFPIYKQIDAMARSREVGAILQDKGVKVIVNFRATHEWSYEAALSGISIGQTIAIGSLGALRDRESRKLLTDSVKALAECVSPKIVIVYGYAPNDVFGSLIERGTEIWRFDSEIAKAFGGGGKTIWG